MGYNYLEFMALARLAEWLDFPVGVIEENIPATRTFTLVVDLPTGAVFHRIPRSRMIGTWKRIAIDPSVINISQKEENHRLERIVMATLTKTIKTVK